MKKLLYINLDFKKYQNKAKGQIRAFKSMNIDTVVATMENDDNTCYFELIEYKNDDFVVIEKKPLTKSYIIKQGNNSIVSLFKRLTRTNKINRLFKKDILKYITETKFDYCYIRRIGFFIIFFRKLIKKISKNSKVLYEIPTYPLDKYDSFLVNLSQKIEMCIFNVFIKKYISVIPVMLQNDAKLDDKMVSIFNAVDFSKFENISIDKPKFKDELNVLIVAHILPWHGYDRLIESINKYDGKIKINVDIFSGIDAETQKLIDLTQKLNLEDKIHFMGQKPLNEILDNISKYHIAVGSLGYHRRNGKYDTSIKNKEYCAMGLPFVCSSDDLSFSKEYKYKYMVSSDDELFSIGGIIEWYKSIYNDDYKLIMRKYAQEKLNFEQNYKKVFDSMR